MVVENVALGENLTRHCITTNGIRGGNNMTAILTDEEIQYAKELERRRAKRDWDFDAQLVFFEYLVGLRDRGITNMLGSAEFLEVEFGVDADGHITNTHRTASEILMNWIASFDLPADQQPSDGR